MELKVWVEGIQRIVCGVNEKTTCQDVVYALAHATGKTGRFTLIERYKNASERLLAPNEQPLKVLLKWGEHSNDVQFILQWAPLDSVGNKALSKHTEPHNEYKLSKHNPSVIGIGHGSAQSNVTASKHKSSPFSSNFGNPSVEEASMKRKDVPSVGVVRGVPQIGSETSTNSNYSALDFTANEKVINTNYGINNKTSGVWSESAIDLDGSPGNTFKDLNLSSPPPYREPPNPSKVYVHSPVSVSCVSKGLPPYREPPPPNLSHQQVHQRVNASASSNVQSNFQISLLSNSGNSNVGNVCITSGSQNQTTNSLVFDSNATNLTPGSGEPHDSLNYSVVKADTTSKIKDYLLSNAELFALNKNVAVSSSNPRCQELVRVINLQRENLTAQHVEMTQYDAEIMFWEGKTREQQRHLEFITKEISRLDLINSQQESQVLSLMHLEEEDELLKQKTGTLKSEIDLLGTEFNNCQRELENCKSQMAILTNEVHGYHVSMKQRQEEWMQRETTTLAEIDRLKKELELARRETDAVTDLSGTLDTEVSTLEADLAGKKKQMERLINAMKEANLQSLKIQPPDEFVDGGTHHRSGSTRRMIGSPRQLENAAPTSKNPHGVWV